MPRHRWKELQGKGAGDPRTADAGDTGHKGQGAADQTNEGEHKSRRADGVQVSQFLGLAGLDQADDS